MATSSGGYVFYHAPPPPPALADLSARANDAVARAHTTSAPSLSRATRASERSWSARAREVA